MAPGSTYILSAQLPVTIKGNGAELIENSLGVTANTLSMQAGEQLVITTNGASWYTTAYCRSSGRLIGVQTFVASGTYTPTPEMASVIIEAQGGAVPVVVQPFLPQATLVSVRQVAPGPMASGGFLQRP